VNGNYVVTSQGWDNGAAVDVGAVTWGSGVTGVSGVVSATNSLVGFTTGDQVGGGLITTLTNGNYVVSSWSWDNGAAADAGAVTWGSGTTGVSGMVSPANSLIGSTANDMIGGYGVVALKNGNYVAVSPWWNNGIVEHVGAVTWGSGTNGVSGIVSATNSLVGSTAGDRIGDAGSVGVVELTNGNYVVVSRYYSGGAVTWGSGINGVSGVVSATNSLVSLGDSNINISIGITLLTNGNYVVRRPLWHGIGAVTWGSGTSGVSGAISAANSLIGVTAGDQVGNGGVTALTNGNYVVASPCWNNGLAVCVGAVTWGSGTTGVSGVVSAANSLVGSTTYDRVGLSGVTALTNGNYVVVSPTWDNLTGAVTWGNGTTGVSGVVSAANSLVGSTAGDEVGTVDAYHYTSGLTVLTNGNYVVPSRYWHGVGAVTWGSGTSGVRGVVSAANSLVGSTAGDQIGYTNPFSGFFGITALTNGNYVVASPSWDNGIVTDAGAVTWGNGATGVSGSVSVVNSLVGSTVNDQVSYGVTGLTNGNYVVTSPYWDNGTVMDAGAVTWGSGTTGMMGIVSATNSLVGSTANDYVGNYGVTALTNGDYVVKNYYWDNGMAADSGAITLGKSAGVPPVGPITAANSVLGTAASGGLSMNFAYDDVNDQLVVGRPFDIIVTLFNITPLPSVTSSVRVKPSPTNLASVDFTVTFSEAVTSVDASDFVLTTSGVTGASITNVSGSGTTYTVTVNTGSGDGKIRLDVLDDDSIKNAANNPLGGAGTGNGNFTSGDAYKVIRSVQPATTGVFRPSNGLLYLKNFNTTGIADIAINYGVPGDYPVVGDWDGNGTATIGVYRSGSFYLRNSNTLGFADTVFAFGQPGDQPVAGDWDGDGIDTIGVYRPSTGQFQLRNSNTTGTPDASFYLGNVGDVGIAGDWDGDGKDTTGVFRPSNGIIFLKNTNQTGFADVALNYGLPGDQSVTGDWNGDGFDTIGVYRNGLFYLRNSNTIGFADMVFGLGNPGDMPIAGDWDGLP
jgi:hypothetical protein